MENDLFDSLVDESETGYRLESFELYNWGTFNKTIWSIKPNSKNALLTGDIGSGKSTVVDAITTLLVAPQKITFNKAAGALGKERHLKSYVKGYYKNEKNHTDLSAKPIPLRDNNSYSVILGCFYNKDFQKRVSFAQVFWIKDDNNQPERFYVSCTESLSIAAHFCDFGEDISRLKKRLKAKNNVLVFDRFKQYETELKRQLGLNSSQALDLFYQTVSMKSVGNLTDFVRTHMLEKQAIEKDISAICQRFADLDQAHKSVLKAKDKINKLQPIEDGFNDYCAYQKHLEFQETLFQEVPTYFAQIKHDLLQHQITVNEEKLNKHIARIERFEQDIIKENTNKASLDTAIYDNGGQRLDELKNQIEQKQQEQIRRKNNEQHYKTYCKTAELSFANNETEFQKNKSDSIAQIELHENTLQLRQKDRDDSVYLYREKQKQEAKLQKEITSLKEQKSNIHRANLTIREQLCLSLNINTDQLPFVGELIQVREKHQQWQGAIERLMHNYALSLLVPEHLYKDVANYVNKTHLKGRLVYFKTSDAVALVSQAQTLSLVYHKLQFNTDSPFYDWLKADVIKRFNYHCCDNLNSFKKNKYAISLTGQIKSGNRHEKDDRKAINNVDNYVLGWSNQQKRESYQEQLKMVQKEGANHFSLVQKIETQISQLGKKKDSLQFLINIETYNEIYWKGLATDINSHNQEIIQITQSSNQLEVLEKKREIVIEKINNYITSKDKHLTKKGATEATLEANENELNRLKTDFAPFTMSQSKAIQVLVDKEVTKNDISLSNQELYQKKVSSSITDEIKTVNKKALNSSNKIVADMQKFKDIYKVETRDLDNHINSAKEYIELLVKLKKEDLPRHELRFNEMLKTDTIQDIVLLQSRLDKEQKQIKEKIEIINDSLTQIDYNEGSYIKLISADIIDMDVREFKQMLKKCINNAFDQDNIYNEQKFINVKALIDRFNGREGYSDIDKKWTKKVTDVRRWFVFSASERWKEDDSEKEHFSDSSGKSGGQKEKLAYTVLASALAYQFGIKMTEAKSKSFRFVMIDEAFGKGSDESTHYALELFKKLNLQLLIVTPLQKIHVIENYIKNVHFVSNIDGKNSELNTLTIEKFKENRQKRLVEQFG